MAQSENGHNGDEAGSPSQDAARKQPPRRRTQSLSWTLPPLGWIMEAGRTRGRGGIPKRILSSTLPEAFFLSSNLKESEVVALCEDPAELRGARISAGRRKLGNLRIEVGRLDQPALTELVGGNHDLVIANDVMHGVDDIGSALANIAATSAAEGSIYLSVRGASHASTRLDEALSKFGLDRPETLPEDSSSETSRVLLLIASLGGFLPQDGQAFARELRGGSSSQGAAAPLEYWLDESTKAGLHLRSTTLTSKALPASLSAGGSGLLSSFSLPKLASLVDQIQCPSRLELILSKERYSEPAWKDSENLAKCHPSARFIPLSSIAPLEPPWDALVGAEVEIQGILEKQKFTLSRYMLEILRRADGTLPLGKLMEEIPHEVSLEEITGAFHFLHYSFIMEMLEAAN